MISHGCGRSVADFLAKRRREATGFAVADSRTICLTASKYFCLLAADVPAVRSRGCGTRMKLRRIRLADRSSLLPSHFSRAWRGRHLRTFRTGSWLLLACVLSLAPSAKAQKPTGGGQGGRIPLPASPNGGELPM